MAETGTPKPQDTAPEGEGFEPDLDDLVGFSSAHALGGRSRALAASDAEIAPVEPQPEARPLPLPEESSPVEPIFASPTPVEPSWAPPSAVDLRSVATDPVPSPPVEPLDPAPVAESPPLAAVSAIREPEPEPEPSPLPDPVVEATAEAVPVPLPEPEPDAPSVAQAADEQPAAAPFVERRRSTDYPGSSQPAPTPTPSPSAMDLEAPAMPPRPGAVAGPALRRDTSEPIQVGDERQGPRRASDRQPGGPTGPGPLGDARQGMRRLSDRLRDQNRAPRPETLAPLPPDTVAAPALGTLVHPAGAPVAVRPGAQAAVQPPRPRAAPIEGLTGLYGLYALILLIVPTFGASGALAILVVLGRKRPESAPALTHDTYQRRTVWIAAAAAAAGIVLLAAPWGLGPLTLFLAAAWVIVRGAYGLWMLKSGLPIPRPKGLWI